MALRVQLRLRDLTPSPRTSSQPIFLNRISIGPFRSSSLPAQTSHRIDCGSSVSDSPPPPEPPTPSSAFRLVPGEHYVVFHFTVDRADAASRFQNFAAGLSLRGGRSCRSWS